MFGVYAVIVPHEERFLRETYGAAYDAYAADVPRVLPRRTPGGTQQGRYDPSVIAAAESRTFLTFGLMLFVLACKAVGR